MTHKFQIPWNLKRLHWSEVGISDLFATTPPFQLYLMIPIAFCVTKPRETVFRLRSFLKLIVRSGSLKYAYPRSQSREYCTVRLARESVKIIAYFSDYFCNQIYIERKVFWKSIWFKAEKIFNTKTKFKLTYLHTVDIFRWCFFCCCKAF